MVHDETDTLQHELEQFRAEKEKIRLLVGQIGGRATVRRDRMVNAIFIALLLVLFAADLLRHFHFISLPFPTVFSLEIGVLLVSVKIVWMIHKQSRIEHFQFWILNSIEFRLNDLSKRFRAIEARLAGADDTAQYAGDNRNRRDTADSAALRHGAGADGTS
jgi:hypothetical protein